MNLQRSKTTVIRIQYSRIPLTQMQTDKEMNMPTYDILVTHESKFRPLPRI